MWRLTRIRYQLPVCVRRSLQPGEREGVPLAEKGEREGYPKPR